MTQRQHAVDEAEYLFARVQENRARMCDFFAIIAIGFDILLLSLQGYFIRETALWWICRYAYALAAIWVMVLYSNKSVARKQYWMAFGCAVTSVLCSWIIFDVLTMNAQRYTVDNAFLLSYTIVVGAFVIAMAWVSSPLILAVTFVSLVFSWILPNYVQSAPNRYLACIFIMFLPALNHALQFRLLKTDEREMRVRLSTMPRRMALSLEDSDQSPRERFCICLSSDWRDYQELVSGLTDEAVVDLLEDYYQRVQDLLKSEMADYDYYMDWIADELFVVVYSIETDVVNISARQAMASNVVDLCQKILKMKEEFSKDRELRLGIDIGLSAGQSLIGVIGPTNHRKATALGSNPGRARRMQGCGKLIRLEKGSGDRIVFGDELVIVLQAPEVLDLVIGKYDASARRLRNLEDRTLFYIDAADFSEVKMVG